MINDKYNATGIADPQPLGTLSPESNPGIVSQPANLPVDPGSIKVGNQTVQSSIYPVADGSYISIGTQNTDPSTTAGEAGIAIFDNIGEKIVSITQGNPVALDIIAPADHDTPVALVQFTQTGSSAFVDKPFIMDLNSEVVISTHFSPMFTMNGINTGGGSGVYLSDGTTPNGNLDGDEGDLCVNGANGQFYYCQGGTSWGTTGIGGNVANLYGGSIVSGSATANFPAGWSVNNDGTGLYDITHNLGVAHYAVTVSPNVFATRFAIVYSKGSNDFNVALFNLSGTPTNTDFDFILTY